VPLQSPIVPPDEDPRLEEYDFAEPMLVKPYYLADHPQLRFAPHAKYGGIKVGQSIFQALRRKVHLKSNGRRLCTNLIFGGTFCPIKRLNRTSLGQRDIPADCNGLDEILDATDVQQRRKFDVDKTDPLAVRYKQLGLQYADVDDLPAYKESESTLEMISELKGKFQVFDVDDLTQLTPQQAEKAYRLGEGKDVSWKQTGCAFAAQMLFVIFVS
jgi:hypothetical protein